MRNALSIAGLLVLFQACASGPGAPPTPSAAPSATKTIEVPYVSQIQTLYPNGDVSSWIKTKYDERGRLVSQEKSDANGIVSETRSGSAKGTAWRIAVTNAQSGQIVSYEDLVYSPEGDVVSQTLLNPKEEAQTINAYTYVKGQKTEWISKTGSGVVQARTVYTYDAEGNNVRTEVFDGAGTSTNVFDSVFVAGKLVSRKGTDSSGGVTESTTVTWNGERKIKEENQKPFLRSIEYQYGDKNVPVAAISYVKGKLVEKQLFEYQWIKKTVKVSN